jgi:hypothetical protein
VEEIFDKKIKSTITAAIEAQTKALLADTNTEGVVSLSRAST